MAKRKQPEQEPTRRNDPPEAQEVDLSQQIAAIREMMAQIILLAKDESDSKTLAGLLDKYSQASTRLATLLKMQRSLAGETDLAKALHQALAEVLESEAQAGP